MDPVLPTSVEGKTAATNATVGAVAGSMNIGGPVAVISVGAQRIFIRFAKENDAAVDSTTGFRLAAGALLRMSVPPYATKLQHLRADGSDSDISVLWAHGGN